tara:strand:- start:369 stop:521 length:153 start_codon:yes stop_codon:yes gene_type:complete
MPESKPKRKMNEYMSMVQEARKKDKDSFVYKGNTYKKSKTKTGLTIYKKK